MNRFVYRSMIAGITFGFLNSAVIFTLQPTSAQSNITNNTAKATLKPNLDFRQHFRQLGVEGSILIVNEQGDRVYQHNPQRNRTGFLPAATFEVLTSLMALETGIIADERTVIPWDGIKRQVPEWNRDLNMKEAFQFSAVWFYQVLARRVGYGRMKKLLMQAGYGNQTIGRKEDLDTFWSEGNLRITPQQQIQFLRRLYKNELPFSLRSHSIVKDLMIVEKMPEYTIRGKTGWVGFGSRVVPKIGWFVGYLEKGSQVYFFATNINIRSKQDPPTRIELTRRCWQDLALL